MFRTLVNTLISANTTLDGKRVADALLSVNPLQLSRWLDEVWSADGIGGSEWGAILQLPPGRPLGDIVDKTQLPDLLLATFHSGVTVDPALAIQTWTDQPGPLLKPLAGGQAPAIWRHLLYAYLAESTGLFEIMGEVVRRYVVGESLPLPTSATMVWVRSTEELYFRDPPLFSAGGSMTSQLRPDARINRRNAYWRMFGLDLPHPPGRGIDGQPWKRDAGVAANLRFLEIWNELLRQVWLGYENDTNSSGAKPTDSSYIAYLCRTLSEMLQLRRQGGMLAREEFAYVTMLSWFHLTVEYDTSVVDDLSANAGRDGNPADRLAKIGAQVGISPSRQSRELFELADKISPLMWAIEIGMFNDAKSADLLFHHQNLPNGVTDIATEMLRIIDLWQSATGAPIKDLAVTQRRVQGPVRSAQPTKLLPPGRLVPTAASPSPPRQPSPVPSTNGQPVASRR